MTTFNLITGFLGSGKTTLLSHLLNQLSRTEKIAVIQNEFAPSGVDGKTLKSENDDFHLIEINNGSVFCVCQLGGFNQKLVKLLDDVQPDSIFLEASGLADPISIIELLNAPGIQDRLVLNQIISLVDAPNFFKGLSSLPRFRHQLMVADTVIVNKTDLFDGSLDKIFQPIEALNPHAAIKTAEYARVDWVELETIKPEGHAAARQHAGKQSEGRPEMAACVLRTHDSIDGIALRSFLHKLQSGCPRIKGFLKLENGNTVSINSVYDKLEIRVIENYSGPSELIAFGVKLSTGMLRKLFRQFAQTPGAP